MSTGQNHKGWIKIKLFFPLTKHKHQESSVGNKKANIVVGPRRSHKIQKYLLLRHIMFNLSFWFVC